MAADVSEQPAEEERVRTLEQLLATREIVISCGSGGVGKTTTAAAAAAMAATHLGGKVLVDEPGYYVLYGKLRIASAQVLGVPRLADGPDLEALEQLLIVHRPRLFFTQSLAHNPTGSDLSPAKAFRLLQLAQKYDLRLVENDPLAELNTAQ